MCSRGRSGTGDNHWIQSGLGGQAAIHSALEAIRRAEYEKHVNQILEEELAELNDRDVQAVEKHLDEIRAALSQDIDQTVNLLLGGSLAKHTYAEGMSDVDAIVVCNGTDLQGRLPRDLLVYFREKIASRLPKTEITTGSMAVTVQFSDGTKVQLLPGIRVGRALHVPIPGRNEWGDLSFPERFARTLTKANEDLGGRLVRVVRLFKLAQQSLPENLRLTGYHTEALAVSAFRDYAGQLTLKTLLSHMVKYVGTHLDNPIVDSTGQSDHVDDYLGPSHSLARIAAARQFVRISGRLEAADRDLDARTWEEYLGKR